MESKKLSEVERIKIKFAQELKQAELVDSITDALNACNLSIEPRFIHAHNKPINSVIGLICFGDLYNPYSEKNVSWTKLLELVEALPPVATVLKKDQSTSFMPQVAADLSSVFCIAPLILHIHDGHKYTVEWFTELSNEIIKIECSMDYGGSFIAAYSIMEKMLPGEVIYSNARVAPQLTDIVSESRVVAKAETIVWYSGPNSKNRATVYWMEVGEPLPTLVLSKLQAEAMLKKVMDHGKGE